jgi:hypothetical protein
MVWFRAWAAAASRSVGEAAAAAGPISRFGILTAYRISEDRRTVGHRFLLLRTGPALGSLPADRRTPRLPPYVGVLRFLVAPPGAKASELHRASIVSRREGRALSHLVCGRVAVAVCGTPRTTIKVAITTKRR